MATRIGEFGGRVFGWIARIVPLQVGYWLCDRFGYLLYWRSITYRRNVASNLLHVQRGNVDRARLRDQSINVFRISARNFWDLARSPYYQMDDLTRMIRFEGRGWEVLDEVLERGTGAMLLSGHLGAFDFVGQYINRTKYRPLILTSPTVSEIVFAAVIYWRSRTSGGRIERTSAGSVRRIYKALRSGEVVGLVADRDFSENGSGVPVTFFGVETTLPVGPVRMARDTGAPLVPLFAIRDDNRNPDRYLFYIGDPMYIEKTRDRDEDLRIGVQRMADMLERYIALAPEQWVMFQRVWKEPSATNGRGVFSRLRDVLPDPVAPNDSGENVDVLPVQPDQSAPD